MAGLGLNARRAASQVHRVNHARPRVSHGHIACRLCGGIFMNAQCLIKHIELHIAGDDMASLMRSEPGVPPVAARNVTVPGPALAGIPCSVAGRAPNLQGGFLQVPSQVMSNPNFRNASRFVVPPISRSNKAVPRLQPVPVAGPRINGIEESPGDGTKPYIQLLDHPISATRSTGAQSEVSSGTVDVTLKL